METAGDLPRGVPKAPAQEGVSESRVPWSALNATV